MKSIVDIYSTPEDLTDFTLRFFDRYVQKQRQPLVDRESGCEWGDERSVTGMCGESPVDYCPEKHGKLCAAHQKKCNCVFARA